MNCLGEGHFGKVYRCKNKKSEEIYAVKIIDKTKLKPNDLELIRQEKNFLTLIKHEDIISLKDFFEKNKIFISLLNYMKAEIYYLICKKNSE